MIVISLCSYVFLLKLVSSFKESFFFFIFFKNKKKGKAMHLNGTEVKAVLKTVYLDATPGVSTSLSPSWSYN